MAGSERFPCSSTTSEKTSEDVPHPKTVPQIKDRSCGVRAAGVVEYLLRNKSLCFRSVFYHEHLLSASLCLP